MASEHPSPSSRISRVVDYDSYEPSFIELQPVSSKAKYSSVPSDYDEVGLLGNSDDQLSFAPTASSRRAKFTNFGKTFAKSDRWKYVKFRHYVAEPATSRNVFRGWRKAVVAAAVVTGVVLLINVIFLIAASVKHPPDEGVGVIYTGDCNFVKKWDTILHLFINVLGTCLLAASSFTMQCLSSPTRSEADAAHAKRKSLDIGLPSFKNLFHVNKKKVALWWGLCLSTIPLHLLWNSTVFSTLGANEFSYFVVTEDFLTGASFLAPNTSNCYSFLPVDENDRVIPHVQDVFNAYKAGNYKNMTNDDLIKIYSNPFVTHRNILAVTTATSGTKMSPGCAFNNIAVNSSNGYSQYYPEPSWNGSSLLGFRYLDDNSVLDWLCDGFDQDTVQCSASESQKLYQSNGSLYLRPQDHSDIGLLDRQSYLVDYLLSESAGVETCQLQYVSYILGVVVACNTIKVICMLLAAYVLWDLDEPIFATVGDAVMSYMENPDNTTKGWCIMDHQNLDFWRMRPTPVHDTYKRKPKARLFSATSKTRWIVTIVLCSTYLLVGIILLLVSVSDARGYYDSIQEIWRLGLGDINENTVLGISGNSTKGLIQSVLVANVFQLALSTTYFLYNALYTAQCGALEWTSYVDGKRRPLRVTWPRGQQRSTYYLHLPYRYGFPLTAFLMLLHFLISQSIFLARVQWYNYEGVLDERKYLSDVGFSPVAILVTVCVGAGLIIAQIAHSFRQIDNRIPLHGNSSVIISAMCHTGTGTYENDRGVLFYHPEENMALRNVMWGASQQPKADHSMGHCTFTADAVEMPVQGGRYR